MLSYLSLGNHYRKVPQFFTFVEQFPVFDQNQGAVACLLADFFSDGWVAGKPLYRIVGIRGSNVVEENEL